MMKKTLLAMATATFLMTSCGSIDVDKAVEDFCACKDSDDKGKCHDEWVSTYKGAAGSDEDGKKLSEGMLKCDPMGVVEIAPKLED